jgi:hypothetical protein
MAQDYAHDLASSVSPRSLRIMKRQLSEAPFQTLAEAVALANREMKASFGSADSSKVWRISWKSGRPGLPGAEPPGRTVGRPARFT